MQDTTIKIIDTKSKQIIKSLGRKGGGPDDVQSPSFFYNRTVTADSSLVLVDQNIRKLINISLNDLTLTKQDLPSSLQSKSSINFYPDTAVAYPVIAGEYLFSITPLNKPAGEHRITFPFSVNEENRIKTTSMPTYLASNINTNTSRDRIIVSMYYLDAYYVYDFKGNLIDCFYLSDCDFDINRSINKYFNLDKNGYIRYTRGYSTSDYCYLRRLKEKPDSDNKRYVTTQGQIIKTDWDGNPVSIINIPDSFKSFCVDYNNDIIAITNNQTADGSERFDITV